MMGYRLTLVDEMRNSVTPENARDRLLIAFEAAHQYSGVAVSPATVAHEPKNLVSREHCFRLRVRAREPLDRID